MQKYNDDTADDPLYEEAVEFCRQQGKMSIALIQREFRIGFNRAARLIERMETEALASRYGSAGGSSAPSRIVARPSEEPLQ